MSTERVNVMNEVYTQIKDLENRFPIPTPSATIKMGTFDASTGKFKGNTSDITYESLGDYPGPVPVVRYDEDIKLVISKIGNRVKMEVIPAPKADAVNVLLEFEVKNRGQKDFAVTAKGITVSAPVNQNIVTINVKDSYSVNWHVQSGTKSYGDHMEIQRPPIVGGGAFTIPALPIGLFYEPPCDSQKKNKATYSFTKSMATASTLSFSTEKSTTRPASTEKFSSLPDMQKAFKAAAWLMARNPSPQAQAIAGVLRTIASDGVLGKVSGSETEGVTEAKGNTLISRHEVGRTSDTDVNNGGPGIGDVICFLRNARLVWLASSGRVTLTLLGYDNGPFQIGVGFLKSNLGSMEKTGLDRETGQALLDLDPFVAGGESAVLSQDRFVYNDCFPLLGTGHCEGYSSSHTITNVDRQATTTFRTKAEDYRKGFLSFLGLGVLEDEKVMTTVTQSRETEVSVTEKTEVSCNLCCDVDEVYNVEVYFDRVFGTFAFKRVPVF